MEIDYKVEDSFESKRFHNINGINENLIKPEHVEALCDKINEYYEKRKVLFLKSKIMEFMKLLPSIPKECMSVIIKKQIPLTFLNIINNSELPEIVRPASHAIATLYAEEESCRFLFDDPDFLVILLTKSTISFENEARMLIMCAVVENTTKQEVIDFLFSNLSLKQLHQCLEETSDEDVITSVFIIILKLSTNLNLENDANCVLTIIRESINRGDSDAVRYMVNIMHQLLNQKIFPIKKYTELGLHDIVYNKILSHYTTVACSSAIFLIALMKEYPNQLIFECQNIFDRMKKDIQSSFASFGSVYLKTFASMNQTNINYIINNKIAEYFIGNLRLFSLTPKANLGYMICSVILNCSDEYLYHLADEDLSVLQAIEVCIELREESSIELALKALSRSLDLISKQPKSKFSEMIQSSVFSDATLINDLYDISDNIDNIVENIINQYYA